MITPTQSRKSLTFTQSCRQLMNKHRKFIINEVMVILAFTMSTSLNISTVNAVHYESKDLDHVVELARKIGEEQENSLNNLGSRVVQHKVI